MKENKTCSLLTIENLRVIQCMRILSLSRKVIDTYKYQNRVMRTFYYNLNHIEEIEVDDQDQLIIGELEKQGKEVFHIFQSRGMVEYAPNEKDWMIKRAYIFINRISNDPTIKSTSYDEIGQGELDAFVICDPINIETSEVLADGVFSSIRLSKIKNLAGENKVLWSFEEI